MWALAPGRSRFRYPRRLGFDPSRFARHGCGQSAAPCAFPYSVSLSPCGSRDKQARCQTGLAILGGKCFEPRNVLVRHLVEHLHVPVSHDGFALCASEPSRGWAVWPAKSAYAEAGLLVRLGPLQGSFWGRCLNFGVHYNLSPGFSPGFVEAGIEWLLLLRRALPSPTMCRFIPALSVTDRLSHRSSQRFRGRALLNSAARLRFALRLEVPESPSSVGGDLERFYETGRPTPLERSATEEFRWREPPACST